MKNILILLVAAILLSVPVFAANVESDLDITANGYQCYTMHFEKPYNFNAPDAESSTPTVALTLLDDRITEVQCQGWNWGPYDLAGNRVRIAGPLSDPKVFDPGGTAPGKPNIIIRIIVAVLDFFGKYSGQYSNA